jgi:CheY-like chemotaxis protein
MNFAAFVQGANSTGYPMASDHMSGAEKINRFKDAFAGKKILIVEDIPSNIQLLEAFLTPTGVSLVHKIDGESAFKAFQENPDFDLILMDIRLPDISGLLVTKMIREVSPDVPIIAQTAYALHADRVQCLAAGCNDYIAKPIRRNDLLSIISKYLS